MSSGDFIFRAENGRLKFVGDFDGLYGFNPNPWGQDGYGEMAAYYELSRDKLVAYLRQYLPQRDSLIAIEVGCGHGHLMKRLQNSLGPHVKWLGLDISPIAVAQARLLYPEMNFAEADLCAQEFLPATPLPFADVVILGQILWYILHDIDRALINVYNVLNPNGLLVISQGFLRTQRYGNTIVDGFEGLVSLMNNKYRSLFGMVNCAFDPNSPELQDGLLIYRRK